MPLFERIPTRVEAHQYKKLGEKVHGMCTLEKCMNLPHVHTMHNNQMVVVERGDWIMPEPDGLHFYPCKDEVFRRTYRSVEQKNNKKAF